MASQGFNLKSICYALGGVETKWFKIGVSLGIPRNILKKFKGDDDPLSAVVDCCLQGNATESSEPISWKSIVEALESKYVGEPGLADQINRKYCQQEETKTGKAGDHLAATSQPKEIKEEGAEHKKGNPSPKPSLSNLDPMIRMNLELILTKNLKKIHIIFATYVDTVRILVEKKGVSKEELETFLLSIPATSTTNKKHELYILSRPDKETELKACKTIIEIFNVLKTQCTTFLNYEVYQCILEYFNISEDHDRLKYTEHLISFIQKHTISEFIKINPLLKHKEGTKTLTLKLDIATTCRLAKLDEIKKLIAEIMDLNPSTLELVDIEDGCVTATFLIPSSIADVIFTPNTVFTQQQEDKLRAASVLWLKCNNCTCEFRTKADPALEDQVTCSVCLGRYIDPKLLQCHHTYCQQCLHGLVQQDQQGKLTLTCPTCRQVTPIPSSGVAGLKADFRANQLLEIVDKHKKQNKPTSLDIIASAPHANCCPQHDGKQLDLYCNTCEETICLRCTIKTEKHHDHDYEDLHQAVERKIVASLALMENQLATTNEALTQLDTQCHEISDRQAAIKCHISDVITELQDILEARKTELNNQVDTITQTKLKNLAAQRDQVEAIQAQFSSCLFFVRKNLKTGNLGELMKSTTVKRVEELTTTFRPEELEPNTSTELIFSGTDLNIECQNYGEIYVAAELVDPSKCYIMNKELTIAAVGEKSTAILQTVNFCSQPCMAHDSILATCELVSELTGTKADATVERRGQSQYEISYQPTIKGRHQLHIKVEGQHIRGSPFSVTARSPVEKLSAPIWTITGGVREPFGVVVNHKGEVIVGEWGGHCVTVFGQSREKLGSFGVRGYGHGQFEYPYGVAVDGEENILVADTYNHRILKFTALGEFFLAVGAEGTGPLQFYFPRGIAFNTSNARVYVADSWNNRIQILSSDFNYLGAFGETGRDAGQFNLPWHIACNSTGNVYVADSNNHRIQVFTAEGKFLKMFGKYGQGSGELNEPYGIAIDSSDRVYVSEWGNHRVSVFTSEGLLVTSFGSKGKGRGEFNSPRGIAVDSSGVVYVCDQWNNRVQLF